MRYFTYIAEQSFKTGPNGERLFFFTGPWSRPYVVPDVETERAIYRKQVWTLRIVGLLFLGLIPLGWFGQSITRPIHFFAFMVAAMLAFWLVNYIVLAPELRRCERAAARLSWRSFYTQMADKHSFGMLTLGLAGCLIFVAIGIWILTTGEQMFLGIFNIVVFGLFAVGWAYALSLKRRAVASAG